MMNCLYMLIYSKRNQKGRECYYQKKLIILIKLTKNCNLYVKNLPLDLTDKQLKEIFSKIGEIKSVRISKMLVESRRGNEDIDMIESQRFGYLCYTNEADAKKAIENFNK